MALLNSASKITLRVFTLGMTLQFYCMSAFALSPVPLHYDTYYSVSEPVGNDGISSNRYPKGESSKDWSERLIIRRLGDVDNRPLSEWMKQAEAEFANTCEPFNSFDFSTLDKPGTPSRADKEVFHFWFCYKESGSQFGRQELAKIIKSGGAIYLLVVGSRVPAYSKDNIPKARAEYEKRWFSSAMSFVACEKLTQMQCVPGEALFTRTPVIPASPAELSELALSISRGKALYKQDHLAWYGTDFAVAKKMIPKEGKGLGFLAIPGEGLAGTFYLISAGKKGQPEADSFHADESGKFTVGEHLDALPETLAVRLNALKTARETDYPVCGSKLNSAVIQHENGRDWWVYIMSATISFEQVWLGGNSRIHVSADGTKVISSTPSAKSCLSFNATAMRSMGRDGAAPVTHIVTNVPSEYHVMQSLTHAVPLTVVTDAGVWKVTGDKVEKFSVDVVKKP